MFCFFRRQRRIARDLQARRANSHFPLTRRTRRRGSRTGCRRYQDKSVQARPAGSRGCKCGSRHMPPQAPAPSFPPAPRPDVDDSGLAAANESAASSHLAQHVWVGRCRKTWREPAEGVCRPGLLLHAAAITRPLLVYLSLGVGWVASGETWCKSSEAFKRL